MGEMSRNRWIDWLPLHSGQLVSIENKGCGQVLVSIENKGVEKFCERKKFMDAPASMEV